MAPIASPTLQDPDPPPVRPGRSRRALDVLQRFLFGHDVFVSYARIDATAYAVAIADALIQRRIAAYVDQLGTPPGPKLPPLLMRRLALSSMLVLVGSPGAATSAAVRREVIEFKRRNHRILILDIDGGLDEAEWYREEIRGGLTVRVPRAELDQASASELVVDRIVKGMDFNRREDRLRRTFRRTLAGIALLVVAGGGIAAYEARQVDRQRRIARALDLANQSTAALDESADGLARSTLLAVESLARAWTPEGFGAWARTSQLLPRPLDRTLASGSPGTVAVRFSADGHTLAAWDSSGMVGLRDVASGEVIDSFMPSSPGPPSSLAISGDGTRVFTGFGGGVIAWRRGEAAAETLGARCAGATESIVVAPGDAMIAFACREQLPHVFVRDGDRWLPVPLERSDPTFSRVLSVAISPDGRWLAAGEVGGLSIWDIAGRRFLFRAAASDLWNVAFDRTGERIGASGMTGVWIWDFDAAGGDSAATPSLSEPVRWDSFQDTGPDVIAFSTDGTALLTAGGDGIPRVWDIARRSERLRLPGDRPAVAFDSDGTLVIAGSSGAMRWWASGDGAEDARLPLGAGGRSLAFSPEGRWLAAGGADSTVTVFDTTTWRPATVLRGDAGSVSFARGGGLLVVAGERTVRVFEAPSWRQLPEIPAQDGVLRGMSVAVSDDWLATTARRACGRVLSDDVHVWNLRTGAEAAWGWGGCEMERSPERIGGDAALLERAAAWPALTPPDTSPDGYWRADARDDAVTLTQAATGRTIAALRQSGVRAFAFSPGGDVMATTGEDAVVRLWRVSARARDRLIEQACARMARTTLTADEWATYVGDADPRPSCPATTIRR